MTTTTTLAPLPPRDRPPPPGPLKDVQMPRPSRLRLPNGMQLLAVARRGLPRVTLVARVAAGERDEPRGQGGLATLTAMLLKEGTIHRNARDLAEAIEGVGGSLDTSCEADHTEVEIEVLSPHISLALDLMAEILRTPSFPPLEVESRRDRIIEETRAAFADAGFLAGELAGAVLFGSHPYGALADPRTLFPMGRRDVLGFHLRHFVPAATTLIAIGDLDEGHMLAGLRRRFQSWEAAAPPPRPPRAPRVPPSPQIHLRHRAGSVQSVLRVAARVRDRTSPDFIALEVMNNVLGGGTSSRLFQNLRQAHGYTYGAGSSLVQRELASDLIASASVRTEVTEAALREMLSEIARLRDEEVPREELRSCQEEMVGKFPLSLESLDAIAARLLSQQLFDLPPAYWDRYRRRVMAIRAADVRLVARRYLRPNLLKIVAVGDAAALARPLGRIGTLRRHPPRRFPTLPRRAPEVHEGEGEP